MLLKAHSASKLALSLALASTITACPTSQAGAQQTKEARLLAQSPYVQTWTPGQQKRPQARPTGTASPEDKSKDTATASATASAAPKDTTTFLVKPKNITATASGKWQQVYDSIILKPGEEILPLTLTINNGGDTGKPLRAVRGSLSGRELFNERSFQGKNSLEVDLTGALSSGNTQIAFQMFGQNGQSFSWQLTTKTGPTITKLLDKKGRPGKPVKAEGKFLPVKLSEYKVTVAKKPARVSSVDKNVLTFIVPTDAKGNEKGEAVVDIVVSGRKNKPMKLKLQSPPEIEMFDHISLAPSQTLNIQGKNFGDDSAEVKVFFDTTEGVVSSCSDTSINVVVPDLPGVPRGFTVSVEVSGMKTERSGMIQVGMRNIPNDFGQSAFELPSQLR